jgi:hypothetical protein
MTRTHQPGQTLFRSILPEDIDWKPSDPGPYVIRVKVLSGSDR